MKRQWHCLLQGNQNVVYATLLGGVYDSMTVTGRYALCLPLCDSDASQ